MKTMKRARRRNDLARMKKRVRAIRPWDEKAKDAEHIQACSCHMCGNFRKFYGERTVQERREFQPE